MRDILRQFGRLFGSIEQYNTSGNSILTCMTEPNEHVQILFTNCVPKLTYGAAVNMSPTSHMVIKVLG